MLDSSIFAIEKALSEIQVDLQSSQFALDFQMTFN